MHVKRRARAHALAAAEKLLGRQSGRNAVRRREAIEARHPGRALAADVVLRLGPLAERDVDRALGVGAGAEAGLAVDLEAHDAGGLREVALRLALRRLDH